MSADPTLDWLAQLLLRSSLLLAAAGIAASACRMSGASAAVRHRVWLLALLGLLLLPPLVSILPPLEVPILAAREVGPASVGGSPPQGSVVVLLLYLAGALALLARIAFGRAELRRLWREATPYGSASGAELRLAAGDAMPMTWGTLRPKVLLPSDASSWPEERLGLVLAHELAHVERRDSLVQLAASLACALYWFHPLVWLATRQLRIEQEHAADDRVIATGAPALCYAENLLALAGTFGRRPTPLHAPAMLGRSQLERRLVAIVGAGSRGAPGRVLTCALAAAALAVTIVVAAAAPTPAAEEARDAPPVERVATVLLPPPVATATAPPAPAAPELATPFDEAAVQAQEARVQAAERVADRAEAQAAHSTALPALPARPARVEPVPPLPAVPVTPAALPRLPTLVSPAATPRV